MPSENWFDCRSSSTSHCYLSLSLWSLSVCYICCFGWKIKRKKNQAFELSFFCALCKTKDPKLHYLSIQNYESPIIETKTKLLFLVGCVDRRQVENGFTILCITSRMLLYFKHGGHVYLLLSLLLFNL